MNELFGQELVREYKIPGVVGEVLIFKSVDEKYKIKGEYFGICGCTPENIYGKTLEIVENKILSEGKRYLRNSKNYLEQQMQLIEQGFDFIRKTEHLIHTPEVNSEGGN